MKKIELVVECPSCEGTGVYKGMGEGRLTAVVCYPCDGTGAYKYSYSYKDFTKRNTVTDVERVYLSGMGYKLGLGKIKFSDIGEIDMDKEGVSYLEFINGKKPHHIKKLGCPMRADQGACHNKEGFTAECDRLHGGWIGKITTCKEYPNKKKCWDRFYHEPA